MWRINLWLDIFSERFFSCHTPIAWWVGVQTLVNKRTHLWLSPLLTAALNSPQLGYHSSPCSRTSVSHITIKWASHYSWCVTLTLRQLGTTLVLWPSHTHTHTYTPHPLTCTTISGHTPNDWITNNMYRPDAVGCSVLVTGWPLIRGSWSNIFVGH